MRITGHKWNVTRLHGSFAELWFFLMKKDENDNSEHLPEWPSLKFDYRPIYGFDLDLGIFGPVSSSAEMDTNSGKWS